MYDSLLLFIKLLSLCFNISCTSWRRLSYKAITTVTTTNSGLSVKKRLFFRRLDQECAKQGQYNQAGQSGMCNSYACRVKDRSPVMIVAFAPQYSCIIFNRYLWAFHKPLKLSKFELLSRTGGSSSIYRGQCTVVRTLSAVPVCPGDRRMRLNG